MTKSDLHRVVSSPIWCKDSSQNTPATSLGYRFRCEKTAEINEHLVRVRTVYQISSVINSHFAYRRCCASLLGCSAWHRNANKQAESSFYRVAVGNSENTPAMSHGDGHKIVRFLAKCQRFTEQDITNHARDKTMTRKTEIPQLNEVVEKENLCFPPCGLMPPPLPTSITQESTKVKPSRDMPSPQLRATVPPPPCVVHGDGVSEVPWPLGPNLWFCLLCPFLSRFLSITGTRKR